MVATTLPDGTYERGNPKVAASLPEHDRRFKRVIVKDGDLRIVVTDDYPEYGCFVHEDKMASKTEEVFVGTVLDIEPLRLHSAEREAELDSILEEGMASESKLEVSESAQLPHVKSRDLQTRTKQWLTDRCAERGLPVGGTRPDLVDRLRAWNKDVAA